MQQPKMIVLSLIGIGLRYGFEMEDFAQRTNMRQWAKIGMSTIYKVLKDLEREGAVIVEREESDKGPVRNAYALTDQGRNLMKELIGEALRSDLSIYSERIAGLVFAPLMGSECGRAAISESIVELDRADALLSAQLGQEGMDAIGGAVIEFYRSVNEAEKQAMRTIMETLD